MVKITRDSIIKQAEGIIVSRIDDQIVMMSVENGEYYSLDEVGSRIWELMKSEVVISAIIKKLMEEYDVREEECAEDVISFASKMLEKGIIRLNQ